MDIEDMIQLDTEEKLKIYMNPLRQKIIHEMEVWGKAVTAKQVADRLGISPSSSVHHLKKLQSIGLVELDHTELINGITAKFLRVTSKSVSIGMGIQGECMQYREILVQNILSQVFQGFLETTRYAAEHQLIKEAKFNEFGEAKTGILHLTGEEFQEFCTLIGKFIEEHTTAREGTKAYSYSLVAFQEEIRAEYEAEQMEKQKRGKNSNEKQIEGTPEQPD